MKRLTKTGSYRKHVKMRSLERYGVMFSKETMQNFVSQIQSNKAEFVRRSSLRVTVWRVTHPISKAVIPVVYDKNRKAIVTVLPESAE